MYFIHREKKMVKKNIRTLLALGAAFIHLNVRGVNTYWPETRLQQDEVNYYPQVQKGISLRLFDHFCCDENLNATSAIAVVFSGDSSDTSSTTIEVTENPVVQNLTIIQFALMVGGFEISTDLEEQLMHLDELPAAELEQLAEGISVTIMNLDSLIENNTIGAQGLTNQQLTQILLKIESLIRELTGINEGLKEPEISRNLWRIRNDLKKLIISRLVLAILGTHEITVSKDVSQHELLVRFLLEGDADESPENEDIDIEEFQDLLDEYIRRIRNRVTGKELIRALEAKIKAIERQIARRESNLGAARGSWLRALQNRLDTLRLELNAAELKLSNVIGNYFDTPTLFVDGVTGEIISEPEDHGGKGGGGKDGGKPNPPPSGGNPGAEGGAPHQSSQKNTPLPPPPPIPSHQSPGEGEDDNDGATASDWESTKKKRDMTVWLADLLRQHSLHTMERLDVGSTQAGALLLKIEKQPEKARKIRDKIRNLFRKSYPYHMDLLPAEHVTRLDPYVLAMLKVMRGVAVANIMFDVAEEDELKDIREMYGEYVRGERGQSLRKARDVSFSNSREWEVSVIHNGESWAYDLRGMPVVEQALKQLDLSQILRPGDDGFVRFSEADRVRFARTFLDHSDSGRTPVRFRYIRIQSLGGRTRITREYDLHRFEDLSQHLESRFPRDKKIGKKVNPSSGINGALARASQRGGIEDSMLLILNQNPDAVALLHWLFSPNNSTIPMANLMFGGGGENWGEIEGILQQRGLPRLTPSTTDQFNLDNQNYEVTVFSNGRMRINYTVSYDKVSRNRGDTGKEESYKADFTLRLIIEVDISQPDGAKPGGIRPLFQSYSYEGSIDSEQQNKLEDDLKHEQKIKDLKLIEKMTRQAQDLSTALDEYEYENVKVEVEKHETIREWRQYAANKLKSAFLSYYNLLTVIRTKKLAQYQEYEKARKVFNEAFKRLKLQSRLVNAIQDFPKQEARTFNELSGYISKLATEQQGVLINRGRSDLSYEEVVEKFEKHRKQIHETLKSLQQIEGELQRSQLLTESVLIDIKERVDVAAAQIESLYTQYDERSAELFKLKDQLIKAGAEVELFKVFGPSYGLLNAGRLHTALLYANIDEQQMIIERSVPKVTESEISNRERQRGAQKTPERNLKEILRVLSSANTSPAVSRSMHSSRRFSENTLELSELTRRGYNYRHTIFSDTATALSVPPLHTHHRVRSQEGLVRLNPVDSEDRKESSLDRHNNPMVSGYNRPRKVSQAGASAVIVSPSDMPHSYVQGNIRESVAQLGRLIDHNVPGNALSQDIYRQLQRKEMSVSYFKDQLAFGLDAESDSDYNHLPLRNDWQAVQLCLGEYLRAGKTLWDLTGKLFEILGFEFRRNLSRLSADAAASQALRQSRPWKPSATTL